MNFPLQLSFKIIAIAPQIAVTDAAGQLVMYVRQKAFRLRESVAVFADRAQTDRLYSVEADRVVDFSAQYHFENREGHPIGAVRRQGMRSLWRAHYEVLQGDQPALTIREENPWAKVLDSLLGEIPILGILTGYILHPAYQVIGADGITYLRAVKRPALFESRYTVEKRMELAPEKQELALLGLLMMLLLERRRG